VEAPDYHPPWWCRGPHLQTVWGPLFRHLPPLPLRRERLLTPDGDFLHLDWLEPGVLPGPLVVLLHGLEGSSRSHYITGLFHEAARLGLRAVVMHFRSCSGELNRAPRLYHSGETSDFEWVLGQLMRREPAMRIGLAGVSLGANVMLKWLGERGDAAPDAVMAAVAISTPFDLAGCAGVLDVGLRRMLYTRQFLKTMRAKVAAKAVVYEGNLDVRAACRARTFAEYDRLVTAKIFGFADERDYWARASSGPYLPKIRRPALLINALNDPFIPAAALPAAAIAQSPWLEAAFPAEGGHAGFLEGPRGRRSWAERRALAFLHRHLLA
jgi:predicted alpha/beta-fold hydrolase